uniref:Uncharacterized protein n=1 Tax=Arundo donax TaxID=35708 RepID=A0A0A9CB10_ARUDO
MVSFHSEQSDFWEYPMLLVNNSKSLSFSLKTESA